MNVTSIAVVGDVLLIGSVSSAQDAKSIERGMKVYADQTCSVCHSIAGKGNPKGPIPTSPKRISTPSSHTCSA